MTGITSAKNGLAYKDITNISSNALITPLISDMLADGYYPVFATIKDWGSLNTGGVSVRVDLSIRPDTQFLTYSFIGGSGAVGQLFPSDTVCRVFFTKIA